MNKSSDRWDLKISPNQSIFHIDFKELYDYRDLVIMFVKRDFSAQYKQTILGPLWFFIQPLLTTITFTFVFGHLAGLSSNGLPKPLFYMAGITSWGYFSDCFNKTASVFKDNASIFGKVYFPRLIMPLTIVISNLFRFGLQLVMLVVLMIFYWIKGASFHVTHFLILFPFVILNMAMIGLGLGMIISSLTNKYRDLSFLVTFGVQLLMYLTPVIYPLSEFPSKYKWLIKLNPMTSLIETFKLGFLGVGYFSNSIFIYSLISSLLILLLGILTFNKVQRSFIDLV